jgi:hypothetical protein
MDGSGGYVLYPYAIGFFTFWLGYHIRSGIEQKIYQGSFFFRSAYMKRDEGGNKKIWWF